MSQIFNDIDMWCTSGQFLEISSGDHEEHALLLWHYFQYLVVNDRFSPRGSSVAVELYLVLGTALPEGKTVYVMERGKEPDEMYFWNACTGECFSARDENCPLIDIGCVVKPDEIYANIQVTPPWLLPLPSS